MSKHTFTLEVECETEGEYLAVVRALNGMGEITDEENDYRG